MKRSIMSAGQIKLKKKHIRVKHQKVKLFRANEPLLSVFMWGINHTINELSHVNIPVMLMPDDFRAYSKVKVDNHAFNKENMPSHFKVKEYCPLVFRNLRERFGIDDYMFRNSLIRSQPLPVSNPGKSGAKFYHSYDGLFVVKTLTSEEVEQMHALLKQYHPYVVERHGKTLLPQYLGMYRLTVDGVEHYMCITRNVFSNHLTVHRKYDLKGSTVDREASDKERNKELPTLKDNDLVKDGTKVSIGEEAKAKLMETLSADVGFLTKLHLMDYSLLVGVHDCDRAEQEREKMAKEKEAARLARRQQGEEDEEEDEDDMYVTGLVGAGDDSSGSGVVVASGVAPTPPDSPQPVRAVGTEVFSHDAGEIIPDIDIYAIPSAIGASLHEIYFVAVIDVLTHYGVKKQAAKAAKTVKYGANVDGISTCEPDQYAKRFLDFISTRVIE